MVGIRYSSVVSAWRASTSAFWTVNPTQNNTAIDTNTNTTSAFIPIPPFHFWGTAYHLPMGITWPFSSKVRFYLYMSHHLTFVSAKFYFDSIFPRKAAGPRLGQPLSLIQRYRGSSLKYAALFPSRCWFSLDGTTPLLIWRSPRWHTEQTILPRKRRAFRVPPQKMQDILWKPKMACPLSSSMWKLKTHKSHT